MGRYIACCRCAACGAVTHALRYARESIGVAGGRRVSPCRCRCGELARARCRRAALRARTHTSPGLRGYSRSCSGGLRAPTTVAVHPHPPCPPSPHPPSACGSVLGVLGAVTAGACAVLPGEGFDAGATLAAVARDVRGSLLGVGLLGRGWTVGGTLRRYTGAIVCRCMSRRLRQPCFGAAPPPNCSPRPASPLPAALHRAVRRAHDVRGGARAPRARLV